MLTETHGTWTNSPTSYSYQWEDCDITALGCAPIAGATGQSYSLTDSDVGHTIEVQESASNSAGSGTPVTSNPTLVVAVPPLPAPPRCPTAKSAHLGSRLCPKWFKDSTLASVAAIARVNPIQAIARTAAKRARRFSISVALTKAVSGFFGQQCPRTLRGAGYVNFRQRAARWSITLPDSFGGTLSVIAVGGLTYVDAPGFTKATSRKRWVELRTPRDYATFNRIPLLRDLVVLTNPLRSLDVLRSVKHPHRATDTSGGAIAHSAEGTPSLTAQCNNGQQVAADASADAQRLTDIFSVGVKADQETLSSWAKNKVSAEANNFGVCEVSVSVANAENDGFDVVITFQNPAPPIHVQTPSTTVTTKWSFTYHFEQPCSNGTWQATDSTLLPIAVSGGTTFFSAQRGGGIVTLKLNNGDAALSTSETFTGTVTATLDEIAIIFGVEQVEPTVTTQPTIFTREVDATGTGIIPPPNHGVSPVNVFATGLTKATVVTDPIPITPSEVTVPRTYDLSGSLVCPNTLTLSSLAFGDLLAFRKISSAVSIPVLTSTSTSTSTEWQAQVGAQTG